MNTTTTRNRPSGLVGFRVDPLTWNLLAGEAARQGINPAELAKSYVICGAHERAARDTLLQEIFLLRQEISQLRDRHSTGKTAACPSGAVPGPEPGKGGLQLEASPHEQ